MKIELRATGARLPENIAFMRFPGRHTASRPETAHALLHRRDETSVLKNQTG